MYVFVWMAVKVGGVAGLEEAEDKKLEERVRKEVSERAGVKRGESHRK